MTDGDTKAAIEQVRDALSYGLGLRSGAKELPTLPETFAALDLIATTLSEQEAELGRYREALEIARRMQRLAARALTLTQDSAP